MDDEATKLPEIPDLEHPSAFQPVNIHPLSKSEASTIFGRFAQKVALIFTKAPEKSQAKLSGRVHELLTNANTVLFELLDLKKEIKERVDPDLFSMLLTILDPLIKEVGRQPPALQKDENTAKQVKMFSRYVDSIEKAKIWVGIGEKHQVKYELEHALIQQTAIEFLARIDRDMQIIQDYLNHALNSLEMSEAMKSELKETLMPDLTPKMLQLYQLKKLPADFSLNSFLQWRSHADRNREIIFGDVLHIIDSFSHDFLPFPKQEEENEQAKVILEQLTAIEERIEKVISEMATIQSYKGKQKRHFESMLENLEDDVHQLNTNMHLSQEHGDKIESLLERLLELREALYQT